MPSTWTPRTKTSLPAFRWDDLNNFWDETEIKWDADGWVDHPRTSGMIETENYLKINSTDFLLINDTDKLITILNSNSIWTTRTKI
jgi:hypothetical protein